MLPVSHFEFETPALRAKERKILSFDIHYVGILMTEMSN